MVSRVNLSRHRIGQGLYLLGALIILATFVIKDVMGDRRHDLIGSLDEVQNVYTIRTDIQDLSRADREALHFLYLKQRGLQNLIRGRQTVKTSQRTCT